MVIRFLGWGAGGLTMMAYAKRVVKGVRGDKRNCALESGRDRVWGFVQGGRRG